MLIAILGIGAGYLIDAGSCLAIPLAAIELSPQPPQGGIACLLGAGLIMSLFPALDRYRPAGAVERQQPA